MEKEQLVLFAGKNNASTETQKNTLISSGLSVKSVNPADRLFKVLPAEEADLILLEAEAFGSGLTDTITKIKGQVPATPVAVLYAQMEDNDILRGFDAGADSFFCASFKPALLGAEIKALIRLNNRRKPLLGQYLHIGPFTYNCSTLQLYKDGVEVVLTSKENALIKLFLDNVGKIFTREALYQMVWNSNTRNDNTIMVYINRIRSKIEPDPSVPQYLQTVRGCGYRFQVPDR